YLVRDPNWFNTRTLNDTAGPAVRAYNNSYDYANVFTKLDTPTKVVSLADTSFYLASPAELLITDSKGRREGIDPATGVTYNEIPGATYYKEGPYVSSDVDVDPTTQHQIKVLDL